MTVRLCPCGTRLEQKKYESEAAYQKRQHCNGKCRSKYYKPKPAERAFGLTVPRNKTQRRTGIGMLSFLYGRPE